jgi:hypothetical protein
MKYRIVKCKGYYKIQRLCLGLFWCWYEEINISRCTGSSLVKQHDECSWTCIIYSSFAEAKEALQNILLTLHNYKGHKIRYSSKVNLFVDMSSQRTVCSGLLRSRIKTYFDIHANTYADICKRIDEQIAKNYAEKHKDDIVEVCLLYDTYNGNLLPND